MKFSGLLSLAATTVSIASAQFQVPVPWYISSLSISNTRHGTGGYWQFNIIDTPTPAPQGFNTTCYFYSNSYYFAVDSPPYDAACTDPSVTFGFFPNASDQTFIFNVTHNYVGACGGQASTPCTDNGTWHFSWDDVRGQESDVQNNFGQAGGFTRAGLSMYPTRAIASSKCEFC